MVHNFGTPEAQSSKEASDETPGSLLRYKMAKEAYYKIKENGVNRLVTKEQYKEAFPEKTSLPSSVIASENRRITHKIRWKLSKLYRNRRTVFVNISKAKRANKEIHLSQKNFAKQRL